MMRYGPQLIGLIVVSLLSANNATSAASSFPLVFETIAIEGDTVFHQGQAYSLRPFIPSVNNQGQVGFSADLQSANGSVAFEALFIHDGVLLPPAVITGTPVPGASPGEFIVDLYTLGVMNNRGEFAVLGKSNIPGGFLGEDLMLSTRGGTLNLIANESQLPPGFEPGIEYRSLGLPYINDNGDVMFFARLRGNEIGRDDKQYNLFAQQNGVVQLVAQGGTKPPGVSGDVVFNFGLDNYNVQISGFNNLGHTLFVSRLTGPGVQAGNVGHYGIFMDLAGNLTKVAIAGETITHKGKSYQFGGFGATAFNNNDQVVFISGLVPGGRNSTSIITGQAGALRVAALQGAPFSPAGPGVTFHSFDLPQINDRGELLFRAILSGTSDGERNSVLLKEHNGQLEVIARAGEQAPDVIAGRKFYAFKTLHMNARGQVAFTAVLEDRGQFSSKYYDALFATTPDDELVLVVQVGQLFDINDDPLIEDLRTVRYIGTPDAKGSFSDTGEFAFYLGFEGEPSGIFTVQIPEPTSGLSLLVAAGMCFRRRRAS